MCVFLCMFICVSAFRGTYQETKLLEPEIQQLENKLESERRVIHSTYDKRELGGNGKKKIQRQN